jgi:hypothetical protein
LIISAFATTQSELSHGDRRRARFHADTADIAPSIHIKLLAPGDPVVAKKIECVSGSTRCNYSRASLHENDSSTRQRLQKCLRHRAVLHCPALRSKRKTAPAKKPRRFQFCDDPYHKIIITTAPTKATIMHTHTATASSPSTSFADESQHQRGQHHEIARRYRRPKRGAPGGPKTNVRISDLDRLLTHRYGEVLPDDDAGAEDALFMLHHLAHLADPERRMRAWLRQRAPSFSKGLVDRLIAKVMRKPMKWKAPKLGQLLRLTNAERELLNITTIRPIDVSIFKRRKKKDAERHATLRLEAGAKPHAMSEAQLKPWVKEGCSESTWHRRKRRQRCGIDSGDSNSSAPYPKDILVKTKRCHATGAPPPKGGSEARAVRALSAGYAIISTETLADRVFMLPRARETMITASSSG